MFKFISELKEVNRLAKSSSISRQELAEKMEKIELPPVLSFISKYSTTFEIIMMWAIPSIISLKIFSYSLTMSNPTQYILMGITPFAFVISFVLMGGFFTLIGRIGLIEGKFPRSYKHPIYALRRIYGTAWSQVYYFKPLYSLCLAVPLLKAFLFRTFGYKGDLSFITYPDSWIRDLPLLKVGKNVYLANRCVVGTNLCLNDNSILVGKCTFADNSMVGHLAIFGLGCVIGTRSEIGVNAGLGIRVKIGDNSSIGPMALVYHGTKLGNRVKIGAAAVVGMKCVIADDIEIKSGAIIPPGTSIMTQKDADNCFAGETNVLTEHTINLFQQLEEHLSNETTIKTT